MQVKIVFETINPRTLKVFVDGVEVPSYQINNLLVAIDPRYLPVFTINAPPGLVRVLVSDKVQLTLNEKIISET